MSSWNVCHWCHTARLIACSRTNFNSNWANKMLRITFPWNGGPEIIEAKRYRQHIFCTCSTWPYTGDDKTQCCFFCALAVITKLQVMRERIPLTTIHSKLHTVVVDAVDWRYNWKTTSLNDFLNSYDLSAWKCIATVRRNYRLATFSWKVKISLLCPYFVRMNTLYIFLSTVHLA